MKYTIPRAVLDLSKNILDNNQKINELLEDLDTKTKNLRTSWQDESYDDIGCYIKNITAHTEEISQETAKIAYDLYLAYKDLASRT